MKYDNVTILASLLIVTIIMLSSCLPPPDDFDPVEPVVEWVFCAVERNLCTFDGTAIVRYGLNESFFYQEHTSSVMCNNTVFGDPLKGFTKECYYSYNADVELTPPPSSSIPVCGNNILEEGEECDDGSLNGITCNPPAGGTCSYCSSDCKNVTLIGDPIIEPPINDFSLFVDVDSLNGQCSDSYARNENSLSNPFCSIQRAADIVEPGDKVRVERGVYEEFVSIIRSGTSSSPIVFSGVRGSDGEWLTVITGGTLAKNWVLAPEIDPEGHGVYKMKLGFRPYSMMANNRMLVHLLPSNNNWLAFSPTHIRDAEVVFWDGIEGIYGYNTSTGDTYVRFRNGDDPNHMSIRAAPNSPAIHVNNAEYLMLSDLSVTNARYAIRVSGTDSRDVLIEDNLLTNSETRIVVDDGASDVTIRGNTILIHSLSEEFTQGPWSDISLFDYSGDVYYDLEVKEQLYRAAHKWNEAVSGRGIEVFGDGHLIEENLIGNAVNAISIRESSDVIVRRNTIENASSVGFISYPGADVHIYDNKVYNVNIPLRFMNMNRGDAQTVYFYNNRVSADPRAGKAAYFHEGFCGENTLVQTHEIWIYHNSFSGSGVGLQSGCFVRNDSGLPGLHVVNNIISSTRSFEFGGDWRAAGMIGGVDHNWFLVRPGSAPWLGSNNIIAVSSSDWMWPVVDRSFVLPSDSPARNSGLDLSKSFVLNGITYQPLPGMEPGYFSGSNPNMGAVQD